MSLPETHWHLAGWHQDWYYNKGPGSTLTIYAPLQDTTGQNGSLQLALGEHHRGPLPHDDHPTEPPTKWHTLSPREVAGFTRVVDTELAVGDVLLFNSLVPHTARVNRSESVRFVVNLRYQDLADPTFLETRWQVAPSPEARQAMARTSP
jgi:ectoine hydroxylase-related dioxygenase (phytanoyl-CoA dioxygenase family)